MRSIKTFKSTCTNLCLICKPSKNVLVLNESVLAYFIPDIYTVQNFIVIPR